MHLKYSAVLSKIHSFFSDFAHWDTQLATRRVFHNM